MNTKYIIITFFVALVVGVGAFYGGMMFQKSQAENRMMTISGDGQMRTFQIGQAGPQGQGFQGRRMMEEGTRPVSGEILNIDEKSATVKMTDGSSKIVILSDKTTISKTSEASVSDLKTGETITAFGTVNSDGSITAQNISVGNSMFRVFQRGEQGVQQGGTPSNAKSE